MTRAFWMWLGCLPMIAAPAIAQSYRVVPEESTFTVDVGTAGLFGMFGHEHLIDVGSFTGQVDWNAEAPEQSAFRLEVDASSLTVADEDVSEEDRQAIQSDMETKALDLPAHEAIVFESRSVEVESSGGDRYELRVRGPLRLRGVEREIEVPVSLAVAGDRLTATGTYELQSDEWGVPQIAAGGGTVKTSEDLELTYSLVAVKE